MKYLSVVQARNLAGLRLVLTAHMPGPWGEAAKAVLSVRQVQYVPVEQAAMQTNDELYAWVGLRNAPVAVLDDEPPQTTPQACDCSASITGASVTLTAGGAMDLAAGSSVSASSAIALYAGYDSVTETYPLPGAALTAAGTLAAPSIALYAGGPIDATGTMTGATQMPNLAYPPAAKPTPVSSSASDGSGDPILQASNTVIIAIDTTLTTLVSSGTSVGGNNGGSSPTSNTNGPNTGGTNNVAAKKLYCN